MANKAVKEYNDFTGTNGYLIVDGLTDNESGGKMKVPNYSGVTDGYVLTKTTTDGADDVVWSAPAGGGVDLPDTIDVSTWWDSTSQPTEEDYTRVIGKSEIYCKYVNHDGNNVQLSWCWKIHANDSAGWKGTQSGQF